MSICGTRRAQPPRLQSAVPVREQRNNHFDDDDEMLMKAGDRLFPCLACHGAVMQLRHCCRNVRDVTCF